MILYTPKSRDIRHPTPNDVCELLKQEADFWEQGTGSGSASLSSSDDPTKRKDELMFYRVSGYGYAVFEMFSYKAPIDEKKDRSVIIAHNVGGEPFPIPSCFYMDYEQAEEILLHYLHTGEILNYDKWQDIHDGFDYDAYYESDEYYSGITVFTGFQIRA